MKLVVDSTVLSGPRSGIGVYVEEVLARLPSDWQVERRGAGQAGGAPSTIKRLVRQVPGAYLARQVALGFPRIPDAVYWAPNFLVPPLVSNAVVTVHDLIFRTHPEWADKTRGAYLRRALEASLKRARAVVVSTQRDKDALGTVFAQKTHVIPPGIRRLQSGAPATEQAYVVAGNLEPRKDAWTALKAHRLLSAEMRRKHPLLFVGAAFDERYARELVESLDPPFSRWLGRIDDASLTSLYANAAAVIAPSLAEGFGFVPLEAYVAGAPILARSLDVTRETMGDRATYFTDVDSLAALMQTPRQKPSDRDRDALATRYSWDETARRYEALIREAAR